MYFTTAGIQLVWKHVAGTAQSATMFITASATYSVILLVLFLKMRWATMSATWFHTADRSILFWAAVAAAGSLLPFTWLQEFLPELDEGIAKTYRDIAHQPLGYMALCLFAPFVEETVFRGAILRSLLGSKLTAWAAIVVSAILFAIAHVNPSQMPHAFIVGIFLGWMYLRTNSILPGVVFHWVNNTTVYSIIMLAPQMEDLTLRQVFGSNLHVAMALAFSLCIFCPSLFQLHLRMKK